MECLSKLEGIVKVLNIVIAVLDQIRYIIKDEGLYIMTYSYTSAAEESLYIQNNSSL
jgi:hypothetical protein